MSCAMIQLLFSTIALFVRILPLNRANRVSVFEASPFRYNKACFSSKICPTDRYKQYTIKSMV